MTPAKRLFGLCGLIFALAVQAACHRPLPRPGKPVAGAPAAHTRAPPPPPPPAARAQP